MKSYCIKIYKLDGNIEIVRTKKKRVFLKNIRTINWQNRDIKNTLIKVTYGKKLCTNNCLCGFTNEAECNSAKELLEYFEYFDKED